MTKEEKEAAKKAKKKRSFAEQYQSFKRMMKYAWDVKGRIACGTFWMLLGSGSDIVMPYMKGMLIDLLLTEDYDRIRRNIIIMAILVAVSCSRENFTMFNLFSLREHV